MNQPLPHAAVLAASHCDRARPYRNIHKALRAQMMTALATIGSADAGDRLGCRQALDTLEQLIEACESHLRHEEDFMHAAMRERDAQAIESFAEDHAQQAAQNRQLRTLIGEVRLGGEAAQAALYRLYLALSVYVAHQFEHMAEEETRLTAAFWANFSDAEIMQIEHRLVASIPPQENARSLGWMIPALHHAERVELLGAMKAAMPTEMFDAIAALARDSLGSQAWARLARSLGIAPVPGLVG